MHYASDFPSKLHKYRYCYHMAITSVLTFVWLFKHILHRHFTVPESFAADIRRKWSEGYIWVKSIDTGQQNTVNYETRALFFDMYLKVWIIGFQTLRTPFTLFSLTVVRNCIALGTICPFKLSLRTLILLLWTNALTPCVRDDDYNMNTMQICSV